MNTLLIHNATCIATFDHTDPSQGRELKDASLFVSDNVIQWIGPTAELPRALLESAGETIDARGHLVTPGLVNTHHHMYQSLTRAISGVQDAELFSWLRGLHGRVLEQMWLCHFA
jgi:cytosine/adenosine deaminase-related metal-dependent hydrolase